MLKRVGARDQLALECACVVHVAVEYCLRDVIPDVRILGRSLALRFEQFERLIIFEIIEMIPRTGGEIPRRYFDTRGGKR